MHTPFLLSSVVLLLATSLASASNTICTYADRDCLGPYGCCSNIQKNACCSWPTNYGWSVRYQNMTASWFGRTYSDSNCQRQAAGISPLVPGDICSSVLNNPNAANWLSANWGPGGNGVRRRDTENHVDGLNCVRPNVIGFTTEDGKEHLVKVPKGTLDEVNEWVKTENFAKLLELDSASAGDA